MKKKGSEQQQQETETEEESNPERENISRDVDDVISFGDGDPELQLNATAPVAIEADNHERGTASLGTSILSAPGDVNSAVLLVEDVPSSSEQPTLQAATGASAPDCNRKRRDTSTLPSGSRGKRVRFA
jgi:hypothetical protein